MTTHTLILAAAIVITSLVLLLLTAAIIHYNIDEKSLISTPNISLRAAVLTSFAKAEINGSVDEVFQAVLNYEECASSVPFSNYKWDDVTVDGVPVVGSTGTFRLNMDDFAYAKSIRIKLSFLDRKNKKVAEMSTNYPSWLLSSERVQEVVPIQGHPNVCEYRTYHTLTGIASYYLAWTVREDLADSQKRCAENLQAYFLHRSKNIPST